MNKTIWIICRNDLPVFYTFDEQEGIRHIKQLRQEQIHRYVRCEYTGEREHWHLESASLLRKESV